MALVWHGFKNFPGHRTIRVFTGPFAERDAAEYRHRLETDEWLFPL